MYNESNNYCEVLVSRTPDKKLVLFSRLYVALAVITGLFALLFNLFYLILTALCLFLRWRMLNQAFVEFEYQFWGRQLDVDCIINSSKRKKLVTYQMDEAEILAREDDPVLQNYLELLGPNASYKTRDLTDRAPAGRPVYILFAREQLDLVKVRLQPSHEMLRQMWYIAPNIVHIPPEVRKEPEER